MNGTSRYNISEETETVRNRNVPYKGRVSPERYLDSSDRPVLALAVGPLRQQPLPEPLCHTTSRSRQATQVGGVEWSQ